MPFYCKSKQRKIRIYPIFNLDCDSFLDYRNAKSDIGKSVINCYKKNDTFYLMFLCEQNPNFYLNSQIYGTALYLFS